MCRELQAGVENSPRDSTRNPGRQTGAVSYDVRGRIAEGRR